MNLSECLTLLTKELKPLSEWEYISSHFIEYKVGLLRVGQSTSLGVRDIGVLQYSDIRCDVERIELSFQAKLVTQLSRTLLELFQAIAMSNWKAERRSQP